MESTIIFAAHLTTTLALLAIVIVSLPWSRADLNELTGRIGQVKGQVQALTHWTRQAVTYCLKITTALWRVYHQRDRAVITQ